MVGIYFLINKGKVVYVGQSIDVSKRVRTHERDKDKEFDEFSVIKCDKEFLNQTEEAYILKYNPKYNKKIANINVDTKKSLEKIERKRTNFSERVKEIPSNKISDFVYYVPVRKYLLSKSVAVKFSDKDYEEISNACSIANIKTESTSQPVKAQDIIRIGALKEAKLIFKKMYK